MARNCTICLLPEKCDCLCSTCMAARTPTPLNIRPYDGPMGIFEDYDGCDSEENINGAS
jgi:hypothetical protein